MNVSHVASYAVVSLDAFAKRILVFFWALYFAEIGITGTDLGFLLSAGTIMGLITVLPIGISNDRIQPKTLLIISFMLIILRFIGVAESVNYWAILFFYVVGGIGWHINKVSVDSMIYKKSSGVDSHKKLAPFLSFLFIFGALGFMTGGYVIEAFKFNTVLIGMSWLMVVGMGISFLLPTFPTMKLKAIDYARDLKKPEAIWFSIFTLLFTLHFGAEMSSYSLFLKHNLGLSALHSGLYIGTAVFIMGGISYMSSKHLGNDKKLLKKSIIIGLLFSGVNHVLMTMTSDPLVSLGFRILHEAGDALVLSFIYNQAIKLFPSERSGGGSGLVNLLATLGASIGALIYSPIGKVYGYHYPLIISGILVIAITPLLFTRKQIIS